MANVYRVDISRLSIEQKQEVDTKLRAVSFMVLSRMDSAGLLIALDAIEDKAGDFKSPDDFKVALNLPDECSIIDVTGWNLIP